MILLGLCFVRRSSMSELTSSHGQAAPCPENVDGTQEYCAKLINLSSLRKWRGKVYLVGVVPDSHTDAALNGIASFDDVLVIRLLLREEGVRGREGHADVKFSDRDLLENFSTAKC